MGITSQPTRIKAAIVAAAFLGITAYWWTRTPAPSDRQELAAVPGAAVSREGVTNQAQLFNEALALLGRRNFVGAESIYREVLVHEPSSAPAYVGIGTVRFQQNDLPGAQKHYARALELDTTSSAAALGLGSVAYSQRRYALAERYYRRALAATGSEADAHWGLGLTHDASGARRKAIEHYAAYVRLAPQSAQAGIARSRIAILDAETGRN
jgi:tetratricopeptide (TPR) repeat protein